MRGRGRAASLLVVGALVTVVLGATMGVGADTDPSVGDAVPLTERHLPTAVNAPGTWSTRYGVDGPVAALGIATRQRPIELFDARQSMELFAVSAVDGSAVWLRLPGFSLKRTDYSSGVAVSPDGQWIGWVRPDRTRRRALEQVSGWSVMDTTTGEIRELEVPGFAAVGGTMADLAFSGDSRYLLTSYETPDLPKPKPKSPRSGAHQLVVWDVADGTPTVIEEPGPYWLPNLGSAPTGVVWSRKQQVFRANPRTGEQTTLTLPQDVITAGWGPDGTSFAYIGRSVAKPNAPWRVYAGRSVDEARGQVFELPDGIHPSQLLGWQDTTHVVVGNHRRSVHVVDIVTGDVKRIDLAGYGDQLNAPRLAGALWQQPLAAPTDPEGTTDPRRPWQAVTVALLAALVGALLVRRRRDRARGSALMSRPPDASASTSALASALAFAARPWRSLATAGNGLLVVLIDVRINEFDLVADPVGWGMVAVAMAGPQHLHPAFSVAGLAAWVAAIVSLPEWFNVDHPLIGPALAAALLVVEVAVCTAVIGVGSARSASASTIRWLTLVLGASLALALVLARAVPDAGVLVFAIGLGSAVVSLWFVVLLYVVARESSASPAQPVPV